MARVKLITRYLLGALLVMQGVNHFVNAGVFARIVPPYLPWHLELVYLSGAAEVVLGLLLCAPRSARLAGWGIILLLVAVFPANVYMAMHAELFPALPVSALWLRLPLQAIFIAWAWWYTQELQPVPEEPRPGPGFRANAVE